MIFYYRVVRVIVILPKHPQFYLIQCIIRWGCAAGSRLPNVPDPVITSRCVPRARTVVSNNNIYSIKRVWHLENATNQSTREYYQNI